MSDVVVVGGGPAGSVTAMLLARKGFDVTLLERRQFPRTKPCGDCLSPAANSVLTRLGVMDDVLRAKPARLRGWRLVAPGGNAFATRFTDVTHDEEVHTALAISRDRLDAILLAHARAAGVDVRYDIRVRDVITREDCVVGVTNGSVEFRAKLTVGADGLRSVVARRLHAYARTPRLRKTSFTVHVELPGPDDFGVMYVQPDACLGIAPVESGDGSRCHNVTLVLNRGSYDRRAGVQVIMQDGLRRFGMGHIAEAGASALTSGPFDWPTRRTVFDGAALVGDAAGYYDPFTGQGIYQAMATAEILAEEAGRALHRTRVRGADLRAFAKKQRQLTRGARRVQRMIEFVCARPQLADRVFASIARTPAIGHTLIGVTGDIVPPHRLLSPLLLAGLAR